MQVAVDYGAAPHHGGKVGTARHGGMARRIAALIDERGNIAKIYDPAGTATFPRQVLADIKKDEL